MTYLSTIKNSPIKAQLKFSSTLCAEGHIAYIKFEAGRLRLGSMKGLLGIKRCTLVRMANWPCYKHTLHIKYEAGAGRLQVSGLAKMRLTPKYEGLLAEGPPWQEWTIAKFRRSIYIGT